MEILSFRRKLLSWYRRRRRDLPWRGTRDPYRVWVSELMLQQTQVVTVIPYYERFLKRFPTVRRLARAPVTAVLDAWSGLGYYSRARNLHAAAGIIARDHAGRLPEEPERLLELPGIGRYTAGAIASIAYGRPAPVLDGNVQRVLCRWLGIRRDPRAPEVQRRLWREAASLVPERAPGDFNQAMMELGATLCVPRAPDCPACPVSAGCAARANGWQERIPPPRRPTPRKRIRYLCGILEKDGALLLARRPLTGLLGGLWEFPGGETSGREPPEEALARLLRERLGIHAAPVDPAGSITQILSHRELEIRAYRCRWQMAVIHPRWYTEARWVPKRKVPALGLTAGMRRLARTLLEGTLHPERSVRVRSVLSLLVLAFSLAGCAATGPSIAPDELRSAQELYGAKAARHAYEQTLRVCVIGERLLRAIPPEERPKKSLPFVGVLLDELDGTNARALGIPGPTPGSHRKACVVTGVLPGSPADQAGLEASDLLLRVNGKETPSPGKLTHALRGIEPGAGITLTLEREGAQLDRRLTIGERPYPVSFIVSEDESVNAFASPGQIVASAGLLRFAESDDELAIVLAHELAHLTRGHIAKGLGPNVVAAISSVPGAAVGVILPKAGKVLADGAAAGVKGSFSRDFEREADYVGLGYAHRAGYEMEAGIAFWDRFATELPASISGPFFKTHPTSPERILRLKKTIEELRKEEEPPPTVSPAGP